MPNWKKLIVSGSDAKLNSVTSSIGINVGGDILPDQDNVHSLGASNLRFQLNGGTPVTVDGSGTANTLTRFQSATTVEDSKIVSSNSATTITHDNDGNTVFTISGSNGELLTVNDADEQDIFRVNDLSGIEIFSVSSSGDLVAPQMNYGQEPFYLSYNSGSGEIRFTSQSILEGTSGTSGLSGTSGVDGNNGTSGTSGNSGTSGTSGIDGNNGTSGTSGVNGTSGSSGTSGVDGNNGTSGSSGTSGTSGNSGTSGVNGTSGSSGTSGVDGDNGTSGTSGNDGANGTSGVSGTSGSSGTSGADGNNGTSGVSGTSGSSGTSGGDGDNGTSGTSGNNAGITSYTNVGNNRIITSVNSSTINSETNLTFDGSTLRVNGEAEVTAELRAGSIVETSAQKHKENILPLESQVENVKKLEPVSFVWKKDKKEDIGLIAEDVEKVLPKMVSYEENGELYGVQYSKLTAILIKAFQEQQNQIEELKEELNKLKNK